MTALPLIIHSATPHDVTWRVGGAPSPWVTRSRLFLAGRRRFIEEHGRALIAGWVLDESHLIELIAAMDRAERDVHADSLATDRTHDHLTGGL